MKQIVLYAALLASIFQTCLAQDKKAEAILKLEQQWDDALTHSDTAALQKLYDDTLIYTHSNGKVDTKSSYIQAIQSGATKYESMKRDDIKVTVYPETAVVTCHWEVRVGSPGNPTELNARYLHVYVHRKDGWKLVAHESTRLAR
jgi:ketosteroid isomerase-like protein